MGLTVEAKAVALLNAGGVTEELSARVYRARSSSEDGRVYRVVIEVDATTCDCEGGRHGRRCHHAVAAEMALAERAAADRLLEGHQSGDTL